MLSFFLTMRQPPISSLFPYTTLFRSPTSGIVTVVDTLPAGLTATAIAGSGWTCVLGTLTCTRSAALADNARHPAHSNTIDGADNDADNVTNSAFISGGGAANTGHDYA